MPKKTSLYRPENGWFGDVMPIHVNGRYHIFYTILHADDLGGPGVLKGLDWAHISTTDFQTFDEHPLAIVRGDSKAADLLVGAGSVVQADDGTFVAFYGGINPARSAWGAAEQVVLRATSTDLETWTKDEAFEFEADSAFYERHDWRDPFVYRDGDGWRMLLCARVPNGPFDRRGVVGQAVSDDLIHWTAVEPFLNPGITVAPECVEVFELEGRRYLLYSTYSDRFQTRHRLIEPDGTIVRPIADGLETNDVYAMNTVESEAGRFLVGWLSTRAQDADGGHRQWGGDLIVHQLHARADGTIGAHPVEGFIDRFALEAATPEAGFGSWDVRSGEASFGQGPFGWAAAGQTTERCAFEATVDLSGSAEEFGIVIHGAENLDAGYFLRFEPGQSRVVFDRRPHRIDVPFDENSDRSYVSAPDHEIERPLIATGDSVTVRIVVDGSAIICYVGDVALTTRGYDLDGGVFALYAANGSASFSGIRYGALD